MTNLLQYLVTLLMLVQLHLTRPKRVTIGKLLGLDDDAVNDIR